MDVSPTSSDSLPPRWSRRDLLALGVWSIAIASYFAPVLAGREVLFYFDITEINYPYRAFYGNELRQGRFPLWCPHLYCGFPLFAESQAGALYPLKLLFYPWMPAWLAFGYDSVVHILFAGVAMYVYLRRRVGPAAALAGAAVFGYGGFLPAHVIHTSYLNSLPWLPLGLLALERGWETGRPAWAAATASCLLMQILAGNMQIAILTFLAYAVLASYWIAIAWFARRPRAALNVGATTAAALVLATAMGAVQIVPSLKLLTESPRKGGLPYEELTKGSWHPELLPASVFPHAFGSRGYDTDWLDGLYPYHEMYCYFGIVTLLLACLGAARWRDRWVFSHVVLSLVCVLFILGNYGILYDGFAYFPVLRGMRMPVRLSVWLGLALGVLTAQGIEGVRDRTVRLRRPIIGFACLVVAAMALVVVMYRPYWLGDTGASRVATRSENRARESLLAGQVSVDLASAVVLVGAALAAIGGARRRPVGRPTRAGPFGIAGICWASLPLLVIADLLWSQLDQNPTIPHEYWSRPPKLVDRMRSESERARIQFFDQGVPGYVKQGKTHNEPGYMVARDGFRTAAETVPMSVAAAWGVDSLRGHTPIRPSRLDRYFDLNQPWTLDVANVRYVASATALPGPLGAYEEVMSRPAHVYRNPNTLPRVRLVDDVEFVADSDAAFRALSRPDFPVRTRIVLEDAERAGTVTVADPLDPLGDVTIESYEPERVRIGVDVARGCYLFLADTFYSEWEALVDGASTRIYPADLTFRAIAVPAGSHRVEFRYRRQAFYRGLTLSGIGLALLIVWGAIFRRRQGESVPLTDGLPGGGRAALAVLVCWIAVLAASTFVKRSAWIDRPKPGAGAVFLVHTYQWEVE